MMLTYDDALARLDGVHESRPGQQATARCPAHADGHASLSIGRADDGGVLLTCFAGCRFADILAALNTAPADPVVSNGHQEAPRRRKRAKAKRFNVVKRPFYCLDVDGDGAGTIVAIHQREDYDDAEGKHDKEMWWERPDGSYGLDGLRVENLPLYRFPTLRVRPFQSRVYLVEGELKCDRLNTALLAAGVDALAVATVTGAAGMPCDTTLAALLDYEVVLWPDNDDPGRTHMQRIAAWLKAKGESPRWLMWPDAPDKGDAADYVAAGLPVADLDALIGDVPEVRAPIVTEAHDRSFPLVGADGQDHADADAAGGHDASDLTRRGPGRTFPLLRLEDLATMRQVRPEVLIAGKIMRRSLTIAYGDSDTGKSYYVQDACFTLAASGVVVWYIAAEGFDGFYLRLLAWLKQHPGADLSALRVIPLPVQLFKSDDPRILAAQARGLGEAQRPALIAIDTVHRCCVGANENDNTDMGCVAAVTSHWRTEVGLTSWAIHHEGKSADRGLRGAACLRNDSDSVQYFFRGGPISVIECEKQKDGIQRFEPEAFTLDPVSLSEQGYPGLGAYVVRALDAGQVAEARRLWRADQQRKQPGYRSGGDGDEDREQLSHGLNKGYQAFLRAYAAEPDGVFKATWREQWEKAGGSPGSFDYMVKQLEQRDKVCRPDTTGRFHPVMHPERGST